MPVDYAWYDDTQHAIRLTALGEWSWLDYHRAMRMALFLLVNIDHQVDTVIDFTRSARMPGGAIAHLRSLAKRQHQNLSGRAVVIGLSGEWRARVAGSEAAEQFQVGDQTVYFVDDSSAAAALLARLRV
ncbi:MAG: hypothetical protein ACOCX3_02440 [Chloroflexota bacterium]